jgi:cell wall-associated NlpC family hydrolase
MLKLKKLLIISLATVMAISLLNISVFASGTAAGTVKCSTYLNVRQSDSSSSAIVGKLYSGQQVTIIGGSYGWYHINYNGKTAWVSGNYITFADKQTTVVETAVSLQDIKYVFGGATPSGFDCSGYSKYVYSKVGVTLVHSAAVQAAEGSAVSRSSLKPGDLVFFATDGKTRNITHVGIYIGDNNVLQAQTGSVQKIAMISLTNSYWSSAYVSARRVLN